MLSSSGVILRSVSRKLVSTRGISSRAVAPLVSYALDQNKFDSLKQVRLN